MIQVATANDGVGYVVLCGPSQILTDGLHPGAAALIEDGVRLAGPLKGGETGYFYTASDARKEAMKRSRTRNAIPSLTWETRP